MRRNILIVDDDQNVLQLVSFFLTQAGFAVKTEHDGFSAINTMVGSHFDLVLLDIAMPHMNGFKVLKAMSENEATKGISVIMMTGSTDKDDIAKAKQFGVADYIIKPPRKEDILARVERVLGGRPQLEEVLCEKELPEAQGTVSFPIRITSASNRGLIVRSPVPVPKGERLTGLHLALFEKLGLKDFSLQVTDCVLTEEKEYEFFLSFIDITPEAQAKIRDWVIDYSFKQKNNIKAG